MKQYFYVKTLIVLLSSVFVMTSCKKYTCECTAYNLYTPESSGYTTFTVKGSKAKRKQLCTDKSTQADNDGNYTTCVIK